MAVRRVTRPVCAWDEDDEHVYVGVEVPGVAASAAAAVEPNVHWTPEGGLELQVCHYALQGQLRYRVSECSWRLLAGELELVFRKHTARQWGALWLQALDEDDAVEVHLRRERGLAQRPRTAGAATVKEPLLRRFRVGRVLSVPIGYTKQLLHGGDGIDAATWLMVVMLAALCPRPSLAGDSGGSSFLVRCVVRALAAPLAWLGLSRVLAMRVAVGTVLVAALKLYRLEIGRDQPQSLARWYGAVCFVQYAFLACLSWAFDEVFALVGALLVLKFWHAERFTRMTFIAVFSSMLLHVDVALLFLVVVADCVVRQRLKLRWLLWCLVVFSAITWLLLSVPWDSYDADRLELWPAAWRQPARVFVWATPLDWLPIVLLAAAGAALYPPYLRHLVVVLAYQSLVWARDSAQHMPVHGVSLLAMPLLDLVAAAAAESIWFKRRRWYAGASVAVLLCCALYTSYQHATTCLVATLG